MTKLTVLITLETYRDTPENIKQYYHILITVTRNLENLEKPRELSSTEKELTSLFSLKLIPIRFKIKFISLLILCIKLSRYILNHKDNFIFETKNTKSKATNSFLGSLVVALDIVFFFFT